MERGMCSGVNNIAGHFTFPFSSAVVVVSVFVVSRRIDTTFGMFPRTCVCWR
jgi:hypothetical protein